MTGEELYEDWRVCGERYWSELTAPEIAQWHSLARAVQSHAIVRYDDGYNQGYSDGYNDNETDETA